MNQANVSSRSLFKCIPCTFTLCLLFGVILSKPSEFYKQVIHVLIYLVLLSLLLVSRLEYSYECLNCWSSFFTIDVVIYFILGFVAFSFVSLKRSKMITFLSSDCSLASQFRKLDLMGLVVVIVPFLIISPTEFLKKDYKGFTLFQSDVFESVNSCESFCLREIWAVLGSCLHFNLIPLFSTLYSLGFCVIYNYKTNTLNSIRHKFSDEADLQQLTTQYDSVVSELEAVAEKQKQFEATFGPLLFLALCSFFIAILGSTENILTSLYLSRVHGPLLCFWFLLFCFDQFVFAGLIFSVSSFNEALRKKSKSISNELRSKVCQNQSLTISMVNNIENRIYESINGPLTFWKLITLKTTFFTVSILCIAVSVIFKYFKVKYDSHYFFAP